MAVAGKEIQRITRVRGNHHIPMTIAIEISRTDKVSNDGRTKDSRW